VFLRLSSPFISEARVKFRGDHGMGTFPHTGRRGPCSKITRLLPIAEQLQLNSRIQIASLEAIRSTQTSRPFPSRKRYPMKQRSSQARTNFPERFIDRHYPFFVGRPLFLLLTLMSFCGALHHAKGQILVPESVQWQDPVGTTASYPGPQGSTLTRTAATSPAPRWACNGYFRDTPFNISHEPQSRLGEASYARLWWEE
jgi:hypothetical protein